MGLTAFILISVGAIAFWLVRGRQASPSEHRRSEKHSEEHGYASVALQCGSGACDAALRLRDKALLAKDAPPLPLAVCDKTTCHCSYQKASDRRQMDGRRTIDVGIRPLIYDGREMRDQAADRRTR